MHGSVPFYVGDLKFGIHEGPETNPLQTLRDNLSFGGGQMLYVKFQLCGGRELVPLPLY